MFQLFFGDPISLTTTLAVLAVLGIIALSFMKNRQITKWGRLILVVILIGTAISGLSATRDAYMTSEAMFAVESLQSTLCSIAGGLIFLIGLSAIFVKRQSYRKFGFFFISLLFILQVITIEASRILIS
jgi:uncharacterized membrane protein